MVELAQVEYAEDATFIVNFRRDEEKSATLVCIGTAAALMRAADDGWQAGCWARLGRSKQDDMVFEQHDIRAIPHSMRQHRPQSGRYVRFGLILGTDARFGCLDGVVRTRGGLRRGTTIAPTITLADHTRRWRSTTDPWLLSYGDWCRISFGGTILGARPTRSIAGVFFRTPGERAAAVAASRARRPDGEARRRSSLSMLWPAEPTTEVPACATRRN